MHVYVDFTDMKSILAFTSIFSYT